MNQAIINPKLSFVKSQLDYFSHITQNQYWYVLYLLVLYDERDEKSENIQIVPLKQTTKYGMFNPSGSIQFSTFLIPGENPCFEDFQDDVYHVMRSHKDQHIVPPHIINQCRHSYLHISNALSGNVFDIIEFFSDTLLLLDAGKNNTFILQFIMDFIDFSLANLLLYFQHVSNTKPLMGETKDIELPNHHLKINKVCIAKMCYFVCKTLPLIIQYCEAQSLNEDFITFINKYLNQYSAILQDLEDHITSQSIIRVYNLYFERSNQNGFSYPKEFRSTFDSFQQKIRHRANIF